MKKFLHPIAIFLMVISVVLFVFCGYFSTETTNGKICLVIGMILIIACVIVELIFDYMTFCENEALKEKNSKK